MNPQWSESKNDKVVLQEPPACSKLFGEFLKYFYTGCISINSRSSTSLLTLADKYNIKVNEAYLIEALDNNVMTHV